MVDKAPVGTRFTAVQDFFSPELKSGYAIGLSYTVREGNDVLAEQVPKWLAEGKISLGGPVAEVRGGDRETVVVGPDDVGVLNAEELLGKKGK